VSKQSYNDILYSAGNLTGFYAPQGAPFSADITGWKALTDRGEPETPEVLRVGRELTRYHSMAGVSGVPAPLLVQNGWTDDLFPAPEALRVWRLFRKEEGARVTLQLGDFGHPRGANKAAVDRAFNGQGARFFAAHLKGEGNGPRHGAVTAYTQTCPKEAPAGGPFRARSWALLHPGSVRIGARAVQRISSAGGDPAVSQAINPFGGQESCFALPAATAPGTAVAQRRVGKPFTLLGLPTVRANIRTSGRGGFIAARLWDVVGGQQTLVARGVYRLEDNQKGEIVFQLFGNGWRFERGHTAKLELAGNDATFLRTSNFDFSVRVSDLSAELPARRR
jgi:predicted acyl esterase